MGTRPGIPLAPRGVKDPTRRQSDAGTRRSSVTRPFFFRDLRVFRAFRGSFPSLSVFSFFCGSLFFLSFALNGAAQDLAILDTAIRSGTTEQKRDALFQIRSFRSEIASRTAIPALTDADPVVRATAASSVIFLPESEAIRVLSPLLTDRDPFVRKEAAYALGNVEDPAAAAPLASFLARERDVEVKAAIASALGQTGSRAAIEPLITLLKRKPAEDEEFLRRSAARSIGQIAQINKTGSGYVVTPQNLLAEKFKTLTGDDLTSKYPVFSAAVVTLTAVLQDKREADDTRREAAFALGSIGGRSAVYALEASRNSPDPYLAEIAREALAKIANANSAN